ncbi:MAG: hypothetical protein HOP28_07760 [Gemmatimonadales bacterium]|nr:hypothetical protein [Gemmatimonadales bacterium]
MRFAQPWSLWLLAALAVPLVIHLRKSRGGRVIRVGSLRHLAGQDAMSRWVPRLREWPLLLVRLALLALFVAILADPYREAGRSSGTERRAAIFVAPEVLDSAGLADPLLDSLRTAGSTVRLLAPGFVEVRLDSVSAAPASAGPVWSLVREALDSLDGATDVLVIAPAEAEHYRGSRPVLPMPVRWHLVSRSPADPWLVRAVGIGDSVHVIVAVMDGLRLREVTMAVRRAGGTIPLTDNEGYFLSAPPGGWLRLLVSGSFRPVPIDSLRVTERAPVRVGIAHAADRAIDARYVSAALRAVAAAGGVPVELSAVPLTQAPDGAPALDWLIWLSSAEPSEWSRSFVEGGGTLLVESRLLDAPPRPSEVVGEGALAPLVAAMPGKVHRREPLPGAGAVLLSDGAGAPLLTSQAAGKGRRLLFGSRFHPAWSPWAVGPALPALLRALLEAAPVRGIDPRPLASGQIVTGSIVTRSAAEGSSRAAGSPLSLTVPGIILLLALWTVERLLAFRRARSAA